MVCTVDFTVRKILHGKFEVIRISSKRMRQSTPKLSTGHTESLFATDLLHVHGALLSAITSTIGIHGNS